jgi:DNA-binding CsgD family transcriptional regulator
MAICSLAGPGPPSRPASRYGADTGEGVGHHPDQGAVPQPDHGRRVDAGEQVIIENDSHSPLAFNRSGFPPLESYTGDHVLKGAELSPEVRMDLDTVTQMATDRMQDLATPVHAPAIQQLSPREKTMLQHRSDGLSVREIAEHLGLTETTVRTFILRAGKKLRARDPLHAVATAIRLGLI